MKDHISAGVGMASKGIKNEKLLKEFTGRWSFMKDLLERLADKNETPG